MAPLPVFVDSSALVALFDADDARHPHAARVRRRAPLRPRRSGRRWRR